MPDSQQPTFNTDKIRKCSYLLPAPGGDVVRDLLAEIERLQRRVAELEESEETAWGIIANAYGGAWSEASKASGWQVAAERWRDEYHNHLLKTSEAVKKGGDDE